MPAIERCDSLAQSANDVLARSGEPDIAHRLQLGELVVEEHPQRCVLVSSWRVDPKLFASRRGPQAAEATGTFATRVLDLTAEDLRAVLAHGEESLENVKEQGIVSYLEVRGTPREIEAIRAKLSKLIESCTGGGEGRGTGTAYRLTIAFFPMTRRSPSAR
jgi:hypothetical protein